MSLEPKIMSYLKANVPAVVNTGVVDTNGTAVTRVSGDLFNTAWAQHLININGVDYAVASVTNTGSLTLHASAGVQTGVAYNFYRIAFVKALQGLPPPYLTIAKVSEQKDYTHDGASGLTRPRFQINVFANTYPQAKLAAVEVKEAMDNWQADGIRFAPLQNEIDLYEEDTKLHHVPLDFFIHYES